MSRASKELKEPINKDKLKDKPTPAANKPAEAMNNASVTILETSGILDAYEYFLRQICKNGLPPGNVYEFAAQQILKFERKRNAEIKKRVALKQSLEALEAQQQVQDQILLSKSPEKKVVTGKDDGKKDKVGAASVSQKNIKGEKTDKADKDKDDKNDGEQDKKDLKKDPPKKK